MEIFLRFLKYNLITISLVILVGCGDSQVAVLQGLDQNAANDVIVTLGANHIEAAKQVEKGGTYTILVASKNTTSALTTLYNNGLPNKPNTTLGDEFKKDGFISSPLEEQSRFIYALEAQISSMISLIDGVNNVSVQITLPQPDDNMLQTDDVKPSASVLIKFKPEYHLEVYTSRIRQLVANAVPGLTPDRVEILFISQEEVN